ncbi:signal recognition particle-docking protein FtsY [Pontibacterium granulatum]|uniref:signal recognition particle-docking protein FtsY n=1 Tax=Pontibacterium granulatum TaxID=2036029 RepID=UPI00249AF6E1|nr:signal recognition particle-docking protein FtsY [Pontibacterium granulatum]MDI3324336.1 signal recognition particle-docking protein FtsY [Pontibacterium granulatum]
MFKKLKSLFGGGDEAKEKVVSTEETAVAEAEVEAKPSVEEPVAKEEPLAEKEPSAEQGPAAEPEPAAETVPEPAEEAPVEEVVAEEPTREQPEAVVEPDVVVEPVEPVREPEPEPQPEPVVAAPALILAAEPEPEKKGRFFARIKAGLTRTKANLTKQLGNLFLGAKEIDDDLLEEIETLLLMADVGVEATTEIIERLTDKVERKQLGDAQALQVALKEELAALLHEVDEPLKVEAKEGPYVILMVGVNGVGKTTTIGKLAKKFQAEGKSVMLAAGDTFRAAAVEQLQVWGERNDVPVVAQHTGADSASVIYDAVQSAQAKNVDVLIADTAGRLQNKDHLMDELAKVVRVMKKLSPDAPHEVMLVLDAGTGQNALSQAKTFKEAVGVSGITLTKLDGTAKGGVIFAIAKQMELPIRFIGVGEQIDDLRPFNSDEFVDALFEE